MYVQLDVSDMDKMCENLDSVWVFGYGSLLWKPEFDYSTRETGFIKGFKRRFWQGNCTHRGTRNKPGRVVTIVKDSQEIVWGVAFKLKGPQKYRAMKGLLKREVVLGGYDIIYTHFTSRDSSKIRTVIVYAATQHNHYYLGDSDLDTMSSEIVEAHGHAGSNVEYVVKLADYCRNNIPEDNDPHLFDLERRVKELLKLRKLITEETKRTVNSICESDSDESSDIDWFSSTVSESEEESDNEPTSKNVETKK